MRSLDDDYDEPMLDYDVEQIAKLNSEFTRWSRTRQEEYLCYTATQFRKDRWKRNNMESRFQGSPEHIENIRFCYLTTGWLPDDDHPKLPFNIEGDEYE